MRRIQYSARKFVWIMAIASNALVATRFMFSTTNLWPSTESASRVAEYIIRLGPDRQRVTLAGSFDAELIKGLRYVKDVKHLHVFDANLSRDHVKFLESLTQLEDLAINNSDIYRGELNFVSRLGELKVLSISGTKLAPATILKLRAHENLRLLYIVNCQVAQVELDALQRAMPRLRVVEGYRP